MSKLNRGTKSLMGLRENLELWRNFQLLILEFNIAVSNRTVWTKAAGFLSHLGTNYGSIKLFSSMTFRVWINCPLVSVFGLAVLVSLFQSYSCINIESAETLGSFQLELIRKYKLGKGEINELRFFRKKLKSCSELFVKGYEFYKFKRSTPVTFFKQLTDYTITVLLTL